MPHAPPLLGTLLVLAVFSNYQALKTDFALCDLA